MCILEKAPIILPVRRSLWPPQEEIWLWSDISFSLRNPVQVCDSRAQGLSPPLARRRSSCPSAFAESGAYPPDRALPGSPRQCFLPLACRQSPKGHRIGARKRRAPGNIILSQPYRRRVSTDRLNREGSLLAASLEGEPGPTPTGKTLPHSYPETRFRRERARDFKKEIIHHFIVHQSCV